jgi:hypothetical protein
MTYANLVERSDLISGLRALADFLEGNPEIPAPFSADVLVFPPGVSDEDGRAEIDHIAAMIGAPVVDGTARNEHYVTSRRFGAVEYRAVFIPPRVRTYHHAQASYFGRIIPGTAEEE